MITDAQAEQLKRHICVDARPSPTFYRWLFGWGWDGAIRIESPEVVQKQYRKMLRKALYSK